MEVYNEQVKETGKRKADTKFIIDVLLLFRPGIIRPVNRQTSQLIQYDMFRNHFKITIRGLWKNKATSFINVFGLTVGLSSCLLIGMYVQHEANYDTFQLNRKRIARVIMEYSFDGSPESKRGNFTSTKVAPVFARTFPEVESSARMTNVGMILRNKDHLVTEPNFLFADSTFFTLFSFQFILGSPLNVLDGPHKVVLTESTAKRYFGNENPVGKILLAGNEETPYEVTGVMLDYPPQSQIKFDFLASFSSLGANQEETYFEANYTTYLLLKDEHSSELLQQKITTFMKKEMAGSGASIRFFLEPFDKIHLYSEYAGFVPNTSIAYLYILSGVALLVLVIVCFTYVNLCTARSVERAREVGVRKSVGAATSQLFWQFIGESFVLCVIAVVISIQIVMVALPYFSQLTEKELRIQELFSPSFILFSASITIVVSLLAGSYPAIVLSGFQPVHVLKGVFKNTHSGKWVQQSLIVFQFAIAVFLIVATLVVQKQLAYIQNKKLGYDRGHILVLPMSQDVLKNLAVIKNELKSNADVIRISSCVSTPVHIGGGYTMRSAAMPENEQLSVTATPIDEDYVKTTGLLMVAGDDLSEQDSKDVSTENFDERVYHFILNESAARQLGWTPEQSIGKKMFMGQRAGFVKGVIRDFHFESMHQTIKPLVLFTELRNYGNLLVKVSGHNLPGTISFIDHKWKQLVPLVPFEYRFLDDDYARLYHSELQLGTVMNLFAGIAIVLACLGLFGLSSYVAQQRIKEIGIRKILGATLYNIIGLLSGNFTRLVILAILIASPIAYWLMHRWLQDFAYRIDVPWWVFAIAGASSLGIALLTVSIQGMKAGLVNPVRNLKSE
jgi:putative ABC transport system permease protein